MSCQGWNATAPPPRRRGALDPGAVRVALVADLRLRDARARRHAVRQPDVPAHRGALADGDAAQDRGPRVHHHVVLDDGMTGDALDRVPVLVEREALRAE